MGPAETGKGLTLQDSDGAAETCCKSPFQHVAWCRPWEGYPVVKHTYTKTNKHLGLQVRVLLLAKPQLQCREEEFLPLP